MDELRRRCELSRQDVRLRYRRLYRDVYLPHGVELTAATRARAAWLSTGATLAGISAAAIFGTKWLDGHAPAEIVRKDRHSQPGMIAHGYRVRDDEVCLAASLPVTTPARTAFDIGRRYPAVRAVPILDALGAATGVTAADVLALADRWPGVRGVRAVRSTMQLVDAAAESPQESRLRLILITGGLPRPESQIRFPDIRIRVDMGWPEWKVAVEYDGVQHWADAAQHAWDIERIELLEAAGWVVVRVSARMLSRPDLIVARVRHKLREAGCPV
jgi:very-short-patch-repair endonuclease